MRLASLARCAVAGLWLLTACGGDGPTDPDDGGDGGDGGGNPTEFMMTATINGQAWSAGTEAGLVQAIQFAPLSGGYLLSGTEAGAGTTIFMTINAIGGPGTYALGVDGVSVPGGFASVSGAGQWITPFSGEAGSITITALTATRIAGTFNFTAPASGGGATGTRVVTNGIFNAPIAGNAIVPVLPDSVGSRLTVTLGGVPWNAAIVSGQTTQTHIALSGINDRQALIFTIPKPTGTGSYQLSNNTGYILRANDPNAVAPAGARCCYGIAGDVGTITFTSLTVTRAKGTLSATLRAQPGTAATGQLVIANGTFDIGLYHNP